MRRKYADPHQFKLDWNPEPATDLDVMLESASSGKAYPEDCSALAFARMEVVRLRARAAVAKALKAGTITKPENCERCLSPGALTSHHEDYRDPLKVQWLCRGCHGKRSREISAEARTSLPTQWKDGFRGTPRWALKAIKRGSART